MNWYNSVFPEIRKAIQFLYEKYAKTVYNSIYRILLHTAESEDILQEVFVSVFQQLNRYQEGTNFGAWVRRIAINQSVSLLRKKKIRFEELPETENDQSEESLNEEEFVFRVTAIQNAIAALPGK